MLNKVPHLVTWEAADGSSAGQEVDA
jgi:hypothetical protein